MSLILNTKKNDLNCSRCKKPVITIPNVIEQHRIGIRIFCDNCWMKKKKQSQNILCAYSTEELRALLDAIKELGDLFAPLAKEIEVAINYMINIMSEFIDKLVKVKYDYD